MISLQHTFATVTAIGFLLLSLFSQVAFISQSAHADEKAVASLDRVREKLRKKQPLHIVAFGDSISEVGRSPDWHGGASQPENNWAQQLGRQLQRAYSDSEIVVINSGIGGQNAYEGLGRIDMLEALKPDLVLVEFGSNDCASHSLEPEQTQLALTTMAQEIKRRFNADVALMSTAGDNPREPFFQHRDETIEATRKAAEAAGVLFVNLRIPILAATNNGERWAEYHLSSRNCHPNDQGHRLWAETVFSALNAILARK